MRIADGTEGCYGRLPAQRICVPGADLNEGRDSGKISHLAHGITRRLDHHVVRIFEQFCEPGAGQRGPELTDAPSHPRIAIVKGARSVARGGTAHPHEGSERARSHLRIRVGEQGPGGRLVSAMAGQSGASASAGGVDRVRIAGLAHERRPLAVAPWQATALWIRYTINRA